MPHCSSRLVCRKQLFTWAALLLLLSCISGSPTSVSLSLDTASPRVGEQVTLTAEVKARYKVYKVTDAVLLEFLDQVERFGVDTGWFREKGGAPCKCTDVSGVTRWWRVAPKLQVLTLLEKGPNRNLSSHHANRFWALIPELRAAGVPKATINRLHDWRESVWLAEDGRTL